MFMDHNKRTTLVWRIDIEKGCACVWGRDVIGKSALYDQFFWETKTVLKNNVYLTDQISPIKTFKYYK